jgi:hypothetical protein
MSPELKQELSRIRRQYSGFNGPAGEDAIVQLVRALGELPADLLDVYRDHNGSSTFLKSRANWIPARLLPIGEAIETNADCSDFLEDAPKAGTIVLLWCDDNSNYIGVYTSGLLRGWLTVLNHEEPALVPAYRSVGAFYARLGISSSDSSPTDLPSIARELPVLVDDSKYVSDDRALARAFFTLFQNEPAEDQRRLYAMCSMALTPVADTKDVVAFLKEDDMWTPEAAVNLLAFRRFADRIDEVERLAREGFPNGDSAAMRHLIQLNTNSSRQAITRLKTALKDVKLERLDQWLKLRGGLLARTWP